ncbi:hypothetical protein ACIQBJ_03705 [Kitasatospora sp. NPDC088391]|uniref:hypothetical protein n=1 Tax=Kitasatospora sp. NPDC088391 TaxID=3364074 RepID=UPI00380C2E31
MENAADAVNAANAGPEEWDGLSLAEQVLVRRAVSGYRTAGVPQHLAAVLRWSGSPEVPALRGVTAAEQARWVPELGAALLRLVGAGWLTVRRGGGGFPSEDDPEVTGPELARLAADPATWLWSRASGSAAVLRATGAGRERWEARAYPPDGPPSFLELELVDEEEREIRVCALESSGWLTGPFGHYPDLPPELAGAELRAHVAAETAVLERFARAGLIEVQHFAVPDSDGFTVVPPDGLVEAFCDRALRCDDREEWGVGFTCLLVQDRAHALR